MRRLTDGRAHIEKECGGITIIVALLMVVLLGFTALAVDTGVLYSERAQLQNGADASAIAIAQKCARAVSDPDCSSTSPMATSFANQNALDGMSNVKSISLETIARKVTVRTSARETGAAANSVSLYFAQAFGIISAEVGARSSAVWGSPKAGTSAFPLTFSMCQVKNDIDGALQLLKERSKTGPEASCFGRNGALIPGGFGWLDQDPGACGAIIDLAVSEGGSQPGASAPRECETLLWRWADEIRAGRETTVLLPVFDKTAGEGDVATYGMVAFAAFKVTGWKFSGSSDLPNTFQNRASALSGVTASTECRGECRGIIGRFVRYVSLSDGYTLGPVDEYGATIVRMTN